MPSTDDVRMERLEQSLARHFDFAWTRLRPFRAGVDAWVDALDLADGRMLVVKTPKLEVQHTRYERTVAFGAELPRQLAAAAELRRAGVPTPRILAHHSRSRGSEEPSWLVMEFVDHEDGDWEDPTLQRELGTLARLSAAPMEHGEAGNRPGSGCNEDEQPEWSEVLVAVTTARKSKFDPAQILAGHRPALCLKSRCLVGLPLGFDLRAYEVQWHGLFRMSDAEYVFAGAEASHGAGRSRSRHRPPPHQDRMANLAYDFQRRAWPSTSPNDLPINLA